MMHQQMNYGGPPPPMNLGGAQPPMNYGGPPPQPPMNYGHPGSMAHYGQPLMGQPPMPPLPYPTITPQQLEEQCYGKK